jgi:hypothetical protein
MAFLEWLQSTWIGTTVAESTWGYPTFETMHAVGMALLIGSLGLIDLRVLGYKPELPLVATRSLLPLAWLGFTLNAISGTLLFMSNAVEFFGNTMFRLKIILIILAGINAALLSRRIFVEPVPGASPVTPTAAAKWIAATSLVFWFGAVVSGRFIAYVS